MIHNSGTQVTPVAAAEDGLDFVPTDRFFVMWQQGVKWACLHPFMSDSHGPSWMQKGS